jgi:hypothetical protein
MEFEKILKVKIYRKIIKFFHENQTSIDTARGVATWTNEDIKQVRVALKKLADQGLLIAHKASSTTAYSYTRNEKDIYKIRQLLEG